MASMFTFTDGTTLHQIKSRELANIPVWKGNRFIDLAHADRIRTAVGSKIDSLGSAIFRTVKYKDGDTEQCFLVDGQHRQYVLKKFYEADTVLPELAPNFDLLVIEKTVESEADAIEYFNILNNVKPQQDHDPKLLANKYILALERHFKKLIRPEGKATKRPFLSADLLRKALEAQASLLKQRPEAVAAFVERVAAWNKKRLAEYELGSAFAPAKDKSILDSCEEKKFILAFDPALPWVAACLQIPSQ
jgi:hypothetical protein